MRIVCRDHVRSPIHLFDISVLAGSAAVCLSVFLSRICASLSLSRARCLLSPSLLHHPTKETPPSFPGNPYEKLKCQTLDNWLVFPEAGQLFKKTKKNKKSTPIPGTYRATRPQQHKHPPQPSSPPPPPPLSPPQLFSSSFHLQLDTMVSTKAEAEALSVEELTTELTSRGLPTEGLKVSWLLDRCSLRHC